MYFCGKEKRDSGNWWKTCGMRDSREKGAGMRDQDPPFQTLLVDTWTPGYTPVINITDELKWWINQSWHTVVRNIPHKQNETGFWIFSVCFLLLLLFFSYFSSFLASFPLILLPTINLSLLQHCTCKFCTYMYCIFFIVDHILIFFTVHAFNLPVST